MKKRVISAIFLIIIAAALIYFGGYAFGIAVTFFASVGLFELMRAFNQKGLRPVKIIAYAYVLLIPMAMILKPHHALDVPLYETNLFPPIQLVIMLILLGLMVFRHQKVSPADCGATLFCAYYVPVLFSFFVLTRNLPDGLWLIIIGVLGSVMADTFALFAGMLFGKKKLIPAISPKKTVAGSIGSFVGSTVFVGLYGLILNLCGVLTQPVSVIHFVILGFLMGATSQIGDLSASAIKRFCGIKDFGKIIPGHGGIMDRFDSMLFNIPLVYCYLQIVYTFTR